MIWLRVIPIILLGPITGPLALGLMGCINARRYVMASVYAAAIIMTWALLIAAASLCAQYLGVNINAHP